MKPLEEKGVWLWNYDSERELLLEIYNIFLAEWSHLYSGKRIVISGKRLRDIITIGFGIGRVDLPALFVRSQLFEIDTSEKLYAVFLKTKVIDLGTACTFLFPEDPFLYPKSANEVAERISASKYGAKKDAGKSVWKAYDEQDFEYIETRCAHEVHQIMSIYRFCSIHARNL